MCVNHVVKIQYWNMWCHTACFLAQDGKVDWNTLGNTLTAALLGEVYRPICVARKVLIDIHFKKKILQVSYLDMKHAAKKGKEDILTDWW